MSIEVTESADHEMEAPPTMVSADRDHDDTEEVDPEPIPAPVRAKPLAKKGPTNGYVPIGERQSSSAVAKAIKEGQNKSLKELIESFGAEGAYQVVIERTEPDQMFDTVTGRTFSTLGYCGRFENKAIDEDFIERKYGGGTFIAKFKDKKPGGSGWQYAGQITFKIQGDPNLTEMRIKSGGPTAAAATTPAGENPSIVKEMTTLLNKELDRANERAAKGGGGDSEVIAMLRDELRASRTEAADARREAREIAARPAPAPAPAFNPMQEKMFEALLEGDSARNTNMRTTHESEIRQLKDRAEDDLRRQQDRFDRLMQDLKNSHEREIASQRQSQEVTLASARGSFETQLAAARASFDLQKQLLESENQRLKAELTDTKSDLKEMRAKKDLSPLEMMKQVETIKNALGSGDEEESSTIGKIAEAVTNPGTWEGVGTMINSLRSPQAVDPKGNPAQQQQALATTAAAGGRTIVKNEKGERFMLVNGKLTGPLKKKGAPPTEPEDQGPKMPNIEPDVIAGTIRFLESACDGQQDPEVVAQSVRSRLPEDLLAAIRDHGVDVVLSKMAKLKSDSPLSSIQGRNWVRKLGKALVGE